MTRQFSKLHGNKPEVKVHMMKSDWVHQTIFDLSCSVMNDVT